jgi:2,3-bisphosphoglycerate-dependent phosphoglycerate mutase
MSIDPAILQKYPKDKVDEAIAFLSYKDPAVMHKEEIPGVPTLYVFRHGQTTDNEAMVFSGWRDVDMTEKGVQQALLLADKLKDKKIDMLISSDLIRTVHTMEIAISKNENAKKLEIIREPRIKERRYGDLQGTSKLLLQLENPELAHEDRRSYKAVPPNGESIEMVVKRVQEFIKEIVPKMKEFNINVAVSCHGNSIRGFRQYFENLTDEETATVESPLGQDYLAYAVK